MGSVGALIGDAIARGSRKEVRVIVLGHIQRGGSPSPYDRVLATRFGVAAVDLIAAGDFGKMVALQAGSIIGVDVAHAIGQLKAVPSRGELVHTARAVGIGFGDGKTGESSKSDAVSPGMKPRRARAAHSL
jgi:ATP-dependent phosphofructokinase / diphosphate-dependent phosphofructokinase